MITRILGMLQKKKKRDKFIMSLPHSAIFDSKWIINIPKNSQTPEAIYKLLRDKKSPDNCYIISSYSGFDGVEMPLKDALDRVVGQVLGGTIIICIPDSLGYFEGEEYGDRYILFKSGNT